MVPKASVDTEKKSYDPAQKRAGGRGRVAGDRRGKGSPVSAAVITIRAAGPKRPAKLTRDRYFLNGDVCRLIFRRKGFKLHQIAKVLRLSNSAVTYLLDGRFAITRSSLAALADLLEVTDSSVLLLKHEERTPDA